MKSTNRMKPTTIRFLELKLSKCTQCGRAFYRTHYLQVMCSKECKKIRAKINLEKRMALKPPPPPKPPKEPFPLIPCKQCGKMFQREKSQERLCSPECKEERRLACNRISNNARYAVRRENPEWIQHMLKRQRDAYRRRRDAIGGQGRKPTVERACEVCGTMFLGRTHRQRLCSMECVKVRRKAVMVASRARIRADPERWAEKLARWKEVQYPKRLERARIKRVKAREAAKKAEERKAKRREYYRRRKENGQ